MEYKDRLFKKKVGGDGIINRYGKENLLIHCGASVNIITNDKRFIVGRKRNTVELKNGVYAQVGGNLNKDEMEIKTFNDIYKYMIKEMNEEIDIQTDIRNLKFHQISFFDSYCGFDFVFYSNLSSKDVQYIKPSEEFSSFEALSLEQIFSLKEKGISDFEYSKEVLSELVN